MNTIEIEIPTHADIYIYIYIFIQKLHGTLLMASAMYCIDVTECAPLVPHSLTLYIKVAFGYRTKRKERNDFFFPQWPELANYVIGIYSLAIKNV